MLYIYILWCTKFTFWLRHLRFCLRYVGRMESHWTMTRQHGKHQATWSGPKTGVPKNGWFILEKPIWLVVSTPLKNMSSSVGSMTFPTEWKVIKFHGSKPHQTTNQLLKWMRTGGTPSFRKPPYGDQRGVARLETFCDSLPVPATDRFMSPAKPWVFFRWFSIGL